MKIALAQLNFHIGNFEKNVSKIIAAVNNARKQQADLIVFAELAICGYPPRDFLEFDDFINQCHAAIDLIAKECIGIAAIVGAPGINPHPEGKNLFNSAYFLSDGQIQSIHHKGLLPNYDVFDEYRYFEHGKKFHVIEYKEHIIALTICEDIWDIEVDRMYTVCPMDELKKQHPDLMINIAASPFSYDHVEARKKIMQRNAVKYQLPLFYVNHVGSQTELIFDGGSMIFDAKGKILDELDYFKEDFRVYEFEKNAIAVPSGNENRKHLAQNSNPGNNKIQRIHDALVLGISDYFNKMGFKKAILGLSGGIDSAVTLVLAAKALGNENVKAVLLPSIYSSSHSIKDAEDLAKISGCDYETIGISDVFNSFLKTLGSQFKDLPSDLAEENIQARTRGVLLMALSNKFGYILLNTSNKSELAVGYGTLYGDMCGGLSVLGDVYKTEIYELAEFINMEKEIIPRNTIVKPPSAELRHDQKDIDSLPDYDLLDKILFQYIENRKGPKKLIEMGFEKELVKRVLKLVNSSEYKRHQTPPILRVSNKAFGMGRRMPIVGKYWP